MGAGVSVHAAASLRGRPWLVLRGTAWEATQWNGPVLALGDVPSNRVGPGSARAGDGAERDRHADPTCRSVATAWRGARRPASRRRRREHVARRDALEHAACLRGLRSATSKTPSSAERSPGRKTRCGRQCSMPARSATCIARPEDPVRGAASRIRSRGLGDANRTAYWCPACQPTADLSGEGGIRTLDERITTRNALAGRRLQPLGHLSRVAQDIGRPGRLLRPGAGSAATLYLPRRGAGAVERGGLENR